MGKTYNKEVNEKIRAYILDHVDLSGYMDNEPETDAEKVKAVHNVFVSEYGRNVSKSGEYYAFMEWLQGLPTALSIDFYYEDVRKVVCGWINEDVEESRKKYDDIKTWELFLNLINREFFAMLRKYNK